MIFNIVKNLRVIGAIVSKQFKHMLRYRMVLIARILLPMVWMVPIIFMGIAFAGGTATGEFVKHTGINDYISFLILGTMLWQFVSSALYEIGFALRMEMFFGTLEQNWVAPANRLVYLLGRSVFSILITAVYLVLSLVFVVVFFNFTVNTSNLLMGIVVMALSLLIFYGFGFIFCGFTLVVKEAGPLAEIVGMSLPILCGASYPITVLPQWMQPVSKVIPLTYSVDCLRAVFLGTKTILPLTTEILILVASAIVVPYVGYSIFLLAERKSRQAGTLGHY